LQNVIPSEIGLYLGSLGCCFYGHLNFSDFYLKNVIIKMSMGVKKSTDKKNNSQEILMFDFYLKNVIKMSIDKKNNSRRN